MTTMIRAYKGMKRLTIACGAAALLGLLAQAPPLAASARAVDTVAATATVVTLTVNGHSVGSAPVGSAPADGAGNLTAQGDTQSSVDATSDAQGSADAADNVQGDLQALQGIANATPSLSAQQRAAVHGDLQTASRDAQSLAAAARPSGGQVGSISVTGSAAADGARILLTSANVTCSTHAVTREVDTVILTVQGERC